MESVLAMLSQSAWMYFTNRLGMVDYVPHGQAQGEAYGCYNRQDRAYCFDN